MFTLTRTALLFLVAISIAGCTTPSWREKAAGIQASLPWSYAEVPWYEKNITQRVEDGTLTQADGEKYLRFYSDQDAGKDFKYDVPMEVFTDAAKSGDSQAQAIIGLQNLIAYNNAPCDVCSSLKWFSEAGLQSHPIAYLYLSVYYGEGYAVEPDWDFACYAASLLESHYGFDDLDTDLLTDFSGDSPVTETSSSTEEHCNNLQKTGFSADIVQSFKAALIRNTKIQPCPGSYCPITGRR